MSDSVERLNAALGGCRLAYVEGRTPIGRLEYLSVACRG